MNLYVAGANSQLQIVMLVTFSWFACSQGIEVMQTRQVTEKIPVSEVPFIMRALGYYPTEQEVISV